MNREREEGLVRAILSLVDQHHQISKEKTDLIDKTLEVGIARGLIIASRMIVEAMKE